MDRRIVWILLLFASPAVAANGARFTKLESFHCTGEGCCDFPSIVNFGACGCADAAEVFVQHAWTGQSWGEPILETTMEACEIYEDYDQNAWSIVRDLDSVSHYRFFNGVGGPIMFYGKDEEIHLGDYDGHKYDLEKLHENPEQYCQSIGGTSAIVSHNPEQRGCKFTGQQTHDPADITGIMVQDFVECYPGFYGPRCEKFCDPEETCNGRGSCNVNSGECICDEGYLRSDCSEPCTRASQCSGNGKCTTEGLEAGHRCTCDSGYFGDDCGCSRKGSCSDHGDCNTDESARKHQPCLCEEGYEGFDCGIKVGSCNSTCVIENTVKCLMDNNNKWVCMCSPHTVGESCDISCACKYGECSAAHDGACDPETDCEADYYGPNCDKPCTCENGYCDGGVSGTGQCQKDSCTEGYWGNDCNLKCTCIEGDCPSTQAEFDPNAVNLSAAEGVNECSTCNENWYGPGCYHQCECRHGTCIGGIEGNGSCVAGSCVDGYQGANCNIMYSEIIIQDESTRKTYAALFGVLAVLCIVVTVVMVVMYKKKMMCFAYRIPIVGEPDDLYYDDVENAGEDGCNTTDELSFSEMELEAPSGPLMPKGEDTNGGSDRCGRLSLSCEDLNMEGGQYGQGANVKKRFKGFSKLG